MHYYYAIGLKYQREILGGSSVGYFEYTCDSPFRNSAELSAELKEMLEDLKDFDGETQGIFQGELDIIAAFELWPLDEKAFLRYYCDTENPSKTKRGGRILIDFGDKGIPLDYKVAMSYALGFADYTAMRREFRKLAKAMPRAPRVLPIEKFLK